jgi:hypothetical protein
MDTWWNTVWYIGDKFTLLQTFQSRIAFDLATLIASFCGVKALWNVVKADFIDTALLKEARNDLEKAKAKQLADTRSKAISTLFTEGNLPKPKRQSFLVTLASIAVTVFAMTKGHKGEYDPALAKQFATLDRKDLSQRRKARARVYQSVAILGAIVATVVKPDSTKPIAPVAAITSTNVSSSPVSAAPTPPKVDK